MGQESRFSKMEKEKELNKNPFLTNTPLVCTKSLLEKGTLPFSPILSHVHITCTVESPMSSTKLLFKMLKLWMSLFTSPSKFPTQWTSLRKTGLGS